MSSVKNPPETIILPVKLIVNKTKNFNSTKICYTLIFYLRILITMLSCLMHVEIRKIYKIKVRNIFVKLSFLVLLK